MSSLCLSLTPCSTRLWTQYTMSSRLTPTSQIPFIFTKSFWWWSLDITYMGFIKHRLYSVTYISHKKPFYRKQLNRLPSLSHEIVFGSPMIHWPDRVNLRSLDSVFRYLNSRNRRQITVYFYTYTRIFHCPQPFRTFNGFLHLVYKHLV